jgi:hypothetical protein
MCLEIAKETMKARDFWRNYREVPEEHLDEVIDAVTKTSEEYQIELAGGIGEVYGNK